MKQIFEWLREQIDKYSYDTETCCGRYIDIIEEKKAIDIINEAEAKWKSECCEWALDKKDYRFNTSCGNKHNAHFMGKYCLDCGKTIKITGVDDTYGLRSK